MVKRTLLVVAVMAIALSAAKLYAGDATSLKMVKPDWHYKWHEGRWWYWMPDNKWVVWTGSSWTPFEKLASCPNTLVSRATPEAIGETTQAIESGSNTYEPAYSGYSGGGNYGSGYSGGSGEGSAGYGWSWGPGTAFRDSPGRRF